MNIKEFQCIKLVKVNFTEGIHDLYEYLSAKADELLIRELVLIDCSIGDSDLC